MSVPRTLALCADDFGLSEGVNRAILRLAAAGRLTEVSCMSNGPAWAAGAHELVGLPGIVNGTLRIGLHWNLTEGAPLAPALRRLWPVGPALPKILLQSHLRRLPQAALREELHAQLATFEAAAGRAPDHLDGHQHIHHLPQLRELVLELAATRPALRLRDTSAVRGPGFGVKRWVIAHSGGTALGPALRARGQQANTELRGVYDFDPTPGAYRGHMRRWLQALPARGALVFCHPGEGDGARGDAIAAARRQELAYLGGEDFAADLREAGVVLGPALATATG